MPKHVGENLSRLLAAQGLSIEQAVEKTGLDRRPIQAILNGSNRAHSQTLNRLAKGLGVAVDELFVDPSRLVATAEAPSTAPPPSVDALVERAESARGGSESRRPT